MDRETFVKNAIYRTLVKVDSREKAVVINGTYFTYKQKSVYAMIYENDSVEFYIREQNSTEDNGETRHSTERAQIHFYTDEILLQLTNIICANSLGDFSIDDRIPVELLHIDIDSNLELLIIEGVLYRLAREAIKQGSVRAPLQNDYFSLAATDVRLLVNAFKEKSYETYYKFIFNKNQRRVLNRCYKKKPFFNILHAFTPVIIYYKYIYNPLIDDPDNQIFKQSNLFLMAEQNNRLVQVNENLYCYMLTHEEICKSLGLTSFMRFTPSFLYRYIVGLLHPELETFPTKTRKVYVRPVSDEDTMGLSTSYSEKEFNDLMGKLLDELDSALAESSQKELKDKITLLSSYSNVDTLYYEIDKELRALVNIGSVGIDGRVNTDSLYSIIFEGQLLLGGD
jgi:hypothetical protein